MRLEQKLQQRSQYFKQKFGSCASHGTSVYYTQGSVACVVNVRSLFVRALRIRGKTKKQKNTKFGCAWGRGRSHASPARPARTHHTPARRPVNNVTNADNMRMTYAAMVKYLDDAVGRLTDQFKAPTYNHICLHVHRNPSTCTYALMYGAPVCAPVYMPYI